VDAADTMALNMYIQCPHCEAWVRAEDWVAHLREEHPHAYEEYQSLAMVRREGWPPRLLRGVGKAV